MREFATFECSRWASDAWDSRLQFARRGANVKFQSAADFRTGAR
jgi:hypothetical protein